MWPRKSVNLALLNEEDARLLYTLFERYPDTRVFRRDKEYLLPLCNLYISHSIVRRTRISNPCEIRYEAIDHNHLIGQGGFSKIYRIFATLVSSQDGYVIKKTKKSRAVKIQSHRREMNEKSKMLEKEIEMSKAAGNLHIKDPAIEKISQNILNSYTVMREINGVNLITLTDLEQDRKIFISTTNRLSITLKIISGLRYLHERKIIHNDIKPDNMLFDPVTCELNFIDYGFSKYSSQKEDEYICGTAGYLAPEIFDDDNTSEKSDVYALGIVIAMLWGASMPEETIEYFMPYPLNELFSFITHDLTEQETNGLTCFISNMIKTDKDLRYSINEAEIQFKEFCFSYVQERIARYRKESLPDKETCVSDSIYSAHGNTLFKEPSCHQQHTKSEFSAEEYEQINSP